MIEIFLTREPIPRTPSMSTETGACGALAEFRGLVRAMEDGSKIAGLRYEAYETMAVTEMHRILAELHGDHPFRKAIVIHRLGLIPTGEAAIHVTILAKHRQEAFAALTGFMDRMKRDVPIWKTEVVPC